MNRDDGRERTETPPRPGKGRRGRRLAHQLSRMEKRGLISREGYAGDARGTLVRLTDAGRTAVRGAAPGHVEWVREHSIGLLSPDELETLAAISERVVAKLEDT